MNLRQRLYKKYRIQGLSGYKAAKLAGYSNTTALTSQKKLDSHCNFNDMMIKAGIDDDSIADILHQGLGAMKQICADVMIQNENGKLVANKNSNDWIEVPDWSVRHKYIETVLKLQGRLKTASFEGQYDTGTKIVIIFPNAKENKSVEFNMEKAIDVNGK